MNIAILGTRGIPANYGGFETFAEELSIRLGRRGHEVTVYGRAHYISVGVRLHRGVRIVRLPCVRTKYLETVSHTAVSILHALTRPYQVLLICNAANAILCGVPRLRGQKVVLNVDGLERLRRKWGWLGRNYYLLSERLATVLPNQVVTDAASIRKYYLNRYSTSTVMIPYGARVGRLNSTAILEQWGISAGNYLLYVSRLEPENNAHLVIKAHLDSDLDLPLVLVGDAPYSQSYIQRLKSMAGSGNVIMPGAVYGRAYWELLSHCLCYIHATEVGGTHPALLEAMGAGCIVLVNDTPENREVVDKAGILCRFEDSHQLVTSLQYVVRHRARLVRLRVDAERRIRELYDWDAVTDQYEALFHELIY